MSGTDSPTTCPRCGHDVGGVVSSWTVFCPLAGTCPECGLSFAWSELFAGRLHPPRWLFEHATPWRAPIALVVTAFAALVPWWLWRRVRMVHPIRPRRCVVLAALPLAGAYLLAVGAVVDSIDSTMQMVVRYYPGTRIELKERLKAIATAVLLPASIKPVGVEIITSNQYAYSLWLNATGNGSTGAPPTLPSPTGSVKMTINLDTPGELWSNAPSTSIIGLAAGPATGVIASALAFAALPIARRRAKVLWSHVFRTTAYGLAAVPVVLVVAIIAGQDALAVGALGFAFLALFWSGTARVYLRMQRPHAVAAAVASIGTLALLIELALCTGAWELVFLRSA